MHPLCRRFGRRRGGGEASDEVCPPPPADLALALHLLQLLRHEAEEGSSFGNFFDEEASLTGLFLASLPSAKDLQGCGVYWSAEDAGRLDSPTLEAEMRWKQLEMEFVLAQTRYQRWYTRTYHARPKL